VYKTKANSDAVQINLTLEKMSRSLEQVYLGYTELGIIPTPTELKQRFLSTLILAFTSILIASFLGIFLGILSAVKHNTWIDQVALSFSAFGISAPSFFVAILIALFFGYYLHDFTGLNFQGSLIDVIRIPLPAAGN
jgi:ABC-type dipeptide/oligopeptide/nickel transport system permease component